MKKLLLTMLMALIATTAFAKSQVIEEGTYINNKRDLIGNIIYYPEHNGYGLSLFRQEGGIYSYDLGNEIIKLNTRYAFEPVENNYDEDAEPNTCILTLEWKNKSQFTIKLGTRCNEDFDQFVGTYTFNYQRSNIPSKFWGKWGETPSCKRKDGTKDYVLIEKNKFSTDLDFGYSIVVYTDDSSKEEKDMPFFAIGIYFYENSYSENIISLKLIDNNKMYMFLTGDQPKSRTLVRCK